MSYFTENGRRNIEEGLRVFSDKPSFYYKLKQPKIDFLEILEKSKKFGILNSNVEVIDFENKAKHILQKIKNDSNYVNLLNGVHIPFVIDKYRDNIDLGINLESELLPCVKESFNNRFPDAHFKAVLQSDSKLLHNIKVADNSNYESFLSKISSGPVLGWYFPQALQEFDVNSQREQMKGLNSKFEYDICLSGALDICASLVATPDLLIDNDSYAPILCISAYEHKDPRLVLLLKAYGPHMEFWCMTQMLTKELTQVSEQWTGGITVFTSI